MEKLDKFYMVVAHPQTLIRDHYGNHRIGDAHAPRSLYYDKAKAEHAAAEMCIKLHRRFYIVECIKTCTPPAPSVDWDE